MTPLFARDMANRILASMARAQCIAAPAAAANDDAPWSCVRRDETEDHRPRCCADFCRTCCPHLHTRRYVEGFDFMGEA